MARIRSIKPEFWVSESVGRLSRDARLLFIGLWSLADDSGRLRGGLAYLSGAVFPYDLDAGGQIEAWVGQLTASGMVRRYLGPDGNSYIDIPNWHKHQKIDKPTASKLPPFAESSRILAESSPSPRESSWEDQGVGSGIRDQGVDQGGTPNLREVMTAGPAPGDVDPDQRYQYVRLQPWAQALIRVIGTKFAKTNWTQWQRLHESYPESLVPTVEALPAMDRWPDQTEAVLEELANAPTRPLLAVTAAKAHPAVVVEALAIVDRIGWAAASRHLDCRDAIRSAGDLREYLTTDPEPYEGARQIIAGAGKVSA